VPGQIPDTLAALREPLDSLKPYPRNPRRGDLGAIRESLKAHGQYRPIVVNRRNHEVLAGNHTYAAAASLGWTEIAVTWVDVDEDTAARIALVDNRASDLATWDDQLLADLLGDLPDLSGTGFTQADLDQLLARLAPPDDFPDPEDGPDPDYQCPSCGYEWTGAPRLGADAD
jgi:ParB-like chromosome segregation protein Spo0J